jgi:hypothetical protein
MDSLGVAQKTQIKELFIGFSCLVSDESIVLILIGAKVEASNEPPPLQIQYSCLPHGDTEPFQEGRIQRVGQR